MEHKSLARGLAYGGAASCLAEVVTMPVDVVKTRLQMDGAGATRAYRGSLDCAAQLVRSEGPGALFKGLPPALLRQSTYGSMRYGLYAPIRDMLGADPRRLHLMPLWKKVAAGAGAGAVASALASPTDLVKVRLQTDGMLRGPGGKPLPRRYHGMLHCLATTVREEGVLGLWTGAGPTASRATALAAAELSSYDEAKARLRALPVGSLQRDGIALHASTALISGFVSTVASSPFDVVKSRVMGQPVDASGRGTLYSGMADCFIKLASSEGPLALYKGFWPNFGRVVPRVTIVFVVMEQLKAQFG